MRRRWGHHGHHAPPRFWQLTRGLHRRVAGVLVVGVTLGFTAGGLLTAGSRDGAWGLVCFAAALFALLWPLSFWATFRIARPLRDLADVAAEIRDGKLQSRDRLRDTPGEVGEVAGALREVSDRLAKQLRDQRALMAAVSHELRSPLGRARVMIEMAREGSAATTVHDDLQAEIDAMDGLVGDLLAGARIDFEAVSPRAMAAVELAHRAVELVGVGKITVEGEPGSVPADPTLVTRALSGLLENARRYGGTTITLRVVAETDGVRFDVDDDGAGFAPGDEVHAFEPFWRGPNPTGRGEGLGLALVRQIAEAHGGAASAERRPEGGARVSVWLPR